MRDLKCVFVKLYGELSTVIYSRFVVEFIGLGVAVTKVPLYILRSSLCSYGYLGFGVGSTE